MNRTVQLRLADTASEEMVQIAPGTPLRIDTVLDTGAFDGGQISIFAALGDDNGRRLVSIGTAIAASSSQSFNAAALTGVNALLFRVTAASGTAGTIAVLTVSQDVPAYVTQQANVGPPLMG